MKAKGKKQATATAAQGSYHYTVYFEPQSNGSFAVLFPTFPEIVTFGRTQDEARAMAHDALRRHPGRACARTARRLTYDAAEAVRERE
jgi:hypothetical protein